MTMSWDEAREEALAVTSGQTRSHVEAAGRLAAFVVEQGDQLRKELDAALAVNARNIAHDAEAVPVNIQFTDELRKAQADLTAAKEQQAVIHRELEAAQRHVTDLQADATARQEASVYRTVRYFHAKFGHPVEHTPRVPEDDMVRFRMKLIAEEFRELFEATFDTPTGHLAQELVGAWGKIEGAINGQYPYERAAVKVNFPEFVDALVDLGYVCEGTTAVCGVMLAPCHALVHGANMAKNAVQVAEKDEHHKLGTRIKPMKPEGWKPPDIRGELIRQGWNSEAGQ